MGRVGPPIALPNGAPQSACEREGWYELAPAKIQSQATTAGIGYNTIYTKIHVGAAIFPVGENDPEKLKDLWPQMSERTLQLKHEARIQPVDDAAQTSLYWALGGLAGFAGGVGVAAATENESKTTAAIFGVSGLALGLVGVVGALVTQPSGLDQLEAEARRKLFFPREDDLTAVARGVNRINGTRRQQCGGIPIPFPPATIPEKPKVPPPQPAPSAPTPAPTSTPPNVEPHPTTDAVEQNGQSATPPAATADSPPATVTSE